MIISLTSWSSCGIIPGVTVGKTSTSNERRKDMALVREVTLRIDLERSKKLAELAKFFIDQLEVDENTRLRARDAVYQAIDFLHFLLKQKGALEEIDEFRAYQYLGGVDL